MSNVLDNKKVLSEFNGVCVDSSNPIVSSDIFSKRIADIDKHLCESISKNIKKDKGFSLFKLCKD